MLKFGYVAVLLAAQLPSFYGVSATDALAPGSSFTEAMINLKKAADVFGSDAYNGPFPVNVTALEVNYNCKRTVTPSVDAYDSEHHSWRARVVSHLPLGDSNRWRVILPLSESDAATLNTVYLPSIQEDILGNLNGLQEGIAFFDGVVTNDLLATMYCHWVEILSLQHTGFLKSLANHAPSKNYTSDWTQPASSTTSQYNIWLAGDGFNCGGAPCWLNGGNV
ncbi:hypothetical protein B0H11DRAFT_1928098 [Mycena galericulata]|nr:hypothetical protein B0H11DRAFT_1928098 [Mycena galericulata]